MKTDESQESHLVQIMRAIKNILLFIASFVISGFIIYYLMWGRSYTDIKLPYPETVEGHK